MSTYSSPADILLWQRQLGLLAVPLSTEPDGQRFVMLNGSAGNFCLDISNAALDSRSRNIAWSADVDHYVALLDKYVEVQRWDKSVATIERFSKSSVFDKLEEFHGYLEKDKTNVNASIIPFTLRTYRSVRALLDSSADGAQALQVFLYLLACLVDGIERDGLDVDKWRIDNSVLEHVSSISLDDWFDLRNSISKGRVLDNLRPDYALTLRHASGLLFQEAHYEVTFVNQLKFPGTLPSLGTINKANKTAGVHFTPPALVRSIVEEAIANVANLKDKQSITIFDPACGSGEFLREAVRQLKLNNFVGTISVFGWDISAAACIMARFNLAWETMPFNSSVNVTIRNQDSLSVDAWPNSVDMLLMNPPFVSWQDMTDMQKASTEQIMGGISERRPDLASVFTFKAATSIAPDGVMGTIIPASLLDSQSARRLREAISNEMSPLFIARLGSHILFPNATIDTAIYVGKKHLGEEVVTTALWANHQVSSNSAALREFRRLRSIGDASDLPRTGNGFSIYMQHGLGSNSKTWSPRPFEGLQLARQLEQTESRVDDLFKVHMGARTGAKNAFVITRHFLDSLPQQEKYYFRPALMNKSVKNGALRDNYYIFYPHGERRILNEDELREVVPTYYYRILEPQKASLESRKSRRQSKWWELSEHRAWLLDLQPRLVSTYFGNVGSFAFDAQGDFVVVQGMAWLYKQGVLERGSISSTPLAKLSWAYLAILNSQFFASLLSAYSNNVSGGQWNLSPKFIKELPIPNLLVNFDSDIGNKLSNVGKEMYNGTMENVDKKEHEELVRNVYGVY